MAPAPVVDDLDGMSIASCLGPYVLMLMGYVMVLVEAAGREYGEDEEQRLVNEGIAHRLSPTPLNTS